MSWVRLYTSILEDPRFHRMPANLFRTWVFLLAIARKHEGQIPDDDDLAFALRSSTKQAADDMEKLIDYGLIVKTETGFTPHDWQRWQYEFPSQTPEAKRLQKRVERGRKNVASDGLLGLKSVGAPEQTTDQIADADKITLEPYEQFADELRDGIRNKPTIKSTSGMKNPTESPTGFDEFLAAYPSHRIGTRQEALHEWMALKHRSELPEIGVILAGLAAHKVSTKWAENGGEFIPNAKKFIVEKRWATQPINKPAAASHFANMRDAPNMPGRPAI